MPSKVDHGCPKFWRIWAEAIMVIFDRVNYSGENRPTCNVLRCAEQSKMFETLIGTEFKATYFGDVIFAGIVVEHRLIRLFFAMLS